jgi:hypothetical protein
VSALKNPCDRIEPIDPVSASLVATADRCLHRIQLHTLQGKALRPYRPPPGSKPSAAKGDAVSGGLAAGVTLVPLERDVLPFEERSSSMRTLALVVVGMVTLGCGSAMESPATGHTPQVGKIRRHTLSDVHTVFLILMENHNWSDIVGNSSAPFINDTLLTQGAHAENYMNPPGVHPSEPNYIWLEAGSNLGVTSDAAPSRTHQSTTRHLVTQLTAKGVSWKSYQEDISGQSCPLTNSGRYAPKHNPMIFFDDVTDRNSPTSATCIAHIRPFDELAQDLGNNHAAAYNFITPNLCNDMHDDCTGDAIKQGDDWLAANVPMIMASRAYQQGGAILITWDEGEGGDGPIGMIALSPNTTAGKSVSTAFDHSSTLRTVQEIFGVTPLLGSAAQATDLAELLQ